jgi:phage tail sheath gpL-like
VYVDFDDSRAFRGPSVLAYKALLIGQRLSSGTKPELERVRLTNADQAGTYFGVGSMLHRQAKKWFQGNKLTETYAIALDDASGDSQAAGTVIVTGTATASGSLALMVNGVSVPVGVTVGMTASQVGDAIVAAIAAITYLPVSGVNTSGSVAITAKNGGLVGNTIDMRINYFAGEVTPAGLVATINGSGQQGVLSGGAVNPDLQDVIDILGEEWYQIIVCPYVDSANMLAIETELTDRASYLRMIDGVYVTSYRPTGADMATKLSALQAFGQARNSRFATCMHGTDTPNDAVDVCASYGAQIATEGSIDPARPFKTLELVGILPPAVGNRFLIAEDNSLLYDGISTFMADSGGRVRIEQAITMYQKNDAGADSISYYKVNTVLTLMFLRYDFRTQIQTRYPRAKLANDGVRVASGQQVITPKIGKAEALSIFRGWELLGLCENIDQFKNDLVCERNISDPNRLDWILPPDLVNQFDIGAATIQFLLESAPQ